MNPKLGMIKDKKGSMNACFLWNTKKPPECVSSVNPKGQIKNVATALGRGKVQST